MMSALRVSKMGEGRGQFQAGMATATTLFNNNFLKLQQFL